MEDKDTYSFKLGAKDCKMGVDRKDNPYHRATPKHDSWDRGWFMARWNINTKVLTKGKK